MASAHAEPIAASDIYVIDGDTIDARGQRIRLVGFDAPELGTHANCAIEQLLGARATARLRQIIRVGRKIDLQVVDDPVSKGPDYMAGLAGTLPSTVRTLGAR